MTKSIVAAMLVAAGITQIAEADEWREPDYPLRGLYAGMDLGGWHMSEQRVSLGSGFTYSPFVGYQFDRYIGLEGAYVGGNAGTSVDGADLSVRVNAAEASAVGSIPLAAYAGLYARVGAVKWWSTETLSYLNFSKSANDNGTNGVYGVGIYEHFDVVASRIEWTRANIQGARVNRFSVAAYWRF